MERIIRGTLHDNIGERWGKYFTDDFGRVVVVSGGKYYTSFDYPDEFYVWVMEKMGLEFGEMYDSQEEAERAHLMAVWGNGYDFP